MQRNCNYINHPLNNSPSKNAYSFGRTQRFLTTHEAKYKSEEPVKYGSISKKKENPSSNTSFTKDSLKNKKEEKQEKCSTRPRVRSLHRKEKQCNEQKKVEDPQKHWQAKEEKEKKIKTEGISEEDGLLKKDNATVLSKAQSQSKLPPRPSTKRDSAKDDAKSTTSKGKPPKFLQTQMKNSMAYTFSRSPRQLHNKNDQLGPGSYNLNSQFGSYASYSSYRK